MPDTMLTVSDLVTAKESASLTDLLGQEPLKLDILYEDDRIAIINKPAGLPMHRTARRETNLAELGEIFMMRLKRPCKLYPVNRLDRGTSGSVILAKSSVSAGLYGRQVKETGLGKLYLALVSGLTPRHGIINKPLDGKASETSFQLLAEGEGCSLVKLLPISGRMHQIRRHMKMIGHPILGDRRYDGENIIGLPGCALHSFKTDLSLSDGRRLTVCAPISDEALDFCESRGVGKEQFLQLLSMIARDGNGTRSVVSGIL